MAPPPISAVGEMARTGDETRFFAALCAPVEMRERLFALVALDAELARVSLTVSEPMLGEIRLQWWVEAIEAMAAGNGARGHPALEELATARLDPGDMIALIEARRLELADEPPDAAGLETYLSDLGRWQGLCVAALGGDEAAQSAAQSAGAAEATGRFLLTLPRLAAGGRAPFSAEVRAALEAGETPDLVRDLAEKALTALNTARTRRTAIPRQARASLLSLSAVEPFLKAAATPGSDLFSESWRPSPFRARLTLLMRAASGRF